MSNTVRPSRSSRSRPRSVQAAGLASTYRPPSSASRTASRVLSKRAWSRPRLAASSSPARFHAVMSRRILENPDSRPPGSCRGVTMPNAQNSVPSFRRCHRSSSARPSSLASRSSCSGTPASMSSGVKMREKCLPTASASVYPMIRSAATFQDVMTPAGSVRKTEWSRTFLTISVKRASASCRRRSASRSAVTSSTASRMSSVWLPSRHNLRALSSITFLPMPGKSCSTSKSSNAASRGRISSRSVRRAGMSHWRLPRSYSSRPSVSPGRTPKVW